MIYLNIWNKFENNIRENGLNLNLYFFVTVETHTKLWTWGTFLLVLEFIPWKYIKVTTYFCIIKQFNNSRGLLHFRFNIFRQICQFGVYILPVVYKISFSFTSPRICLWVIKSYMSNSTLLRMFDWAEILLRYISFLKNCRWKAAIQYLYFGYLRYWYICDPCRGK